MNCLHHVVHWLFPSGAAVAEWVAAAATGVLAGFAWIPLSALRKSLGDSAKAQQDKKRADQFERLKWLDSRFNSPAMLKARSELGKEILNRNLVAQVSQVIGTNAWTVICFFQQIAQMWKQDLLELEDIDSAYGDYIDLLCSAYESHLFGTENIQGRFGVLKELKKAMTCTGYIREFKEGPSGIPEADLNRVRKIFWEREKALLP